MLNFKVFIPSVGSVDQPAVIVRAQGGIVTSGSGGGQTGPVSWADILGKPLTFNPSAHNHSISNISGLDERLTSLDDDVIVAFGRILSVEQAVGNIPSNVEARLIDLDTDINAVAARVLITEQTLSNIPSNIDTRLAAVEGIAGGISALDTRLTAAENGLAALPANIGTRLTAVENGLGALPANLSTRLTTVEQTIAALPSGLSAFGTRLDSAELDIDNLSLSLADTNAALVVAQDKLAGIADGATSNSSDAALRDRATHTGTQPISTVTNLQSSLDAKANRTNAALLGTPTAPTRAAGDASTSIATTEFVMAAVQAIIGLAPADLDTLSEIAARLQSGESDYAALSGQIATLLSKSANLSDLADIATARTNLGLGSAATQSAATLRDRATHTGTQAITTIANLQSALDARVLLSALATVATSGSYNDLLNKPALFSGAYADLSGKPILFSGNYGDLVGAPVLSVVATSGAYADLTGKPALFSGSYTDLTNKPALFSGAYADLTGKPLLATVATSGSYLDLANRPTLATVATSGAYADLTGKPVLFSGSYTDLTNKPTLFSGAYADLTGKPSYATVATTGSYTDLANTPALFSGSYTDLTNKPVVDVAVTFVIDGGGAAIAAGVKGDLQIPFAGTITGWTLLADQSGSIVVEVSKATYSGWPTVAVITASAKPTLSSAQKATSTTLTGWTTAVADGDVLRIGVNSATTVQRVTLVLRVRKT